MVRNWDYAELSKAAKAAGGPEKYVELLELASKKAGKLEMLPWIGAAAAGASLFTTATIKVIDYFKSKKEAAHNEIVLAQEEIIKGIKEYDAAHANEKGDEEKGIPVDYEEAVRWYDKALYGIRIPRESVCKIIADILENKIKDKKRALRYYVVTP